MAHSTIQMISVRPVLSGILFIPRAVIIVVSCCCTVYMCDKNLVKVNAAVVCIECLFLHPCQAINALFFVCYTDDVLSMFINIFSQTFHHLTYSCSLHISLIN